MMYFLKVAGMFFLLSILMFSCAETDIINTESPAQNRELKLQLEVEDFISELKEDPGWIDEIATKIKKGGFTEADLDSPEAIAVLNIDPIITTRISNKLQEFGTFVTDFQYSENEVLAAFSKTSQWQEKNTTDQTGTPCYDVHQLEVQAFTVAMVGCMGLASGGGPAGLAACALTYVTAVGVSRVKYELCVRNNNGGG